MREKVERLVQRPLWDKVARQVMPTLSKLNAIRCKKYELNKAWKKCQGNPILRLGNHKSWDSSYATWASIIRIDGSWHMYYSGKDEAGHLRIGLATSSDGIHWEKYRLNPILDVAPCGHWDSLWAYCPIVLKDGESWKMLFTGCDSLDSYYFRVGLAVSEDGIHWEKFAGNPVFSSRSPDNVNRFGKNETEGWGVILENNRYFLFHNSVTSKPRGIRVASSGNLTDWEEIGKVLPSSGLPWQLGYMKYCAWPFRFDGSIYLFASVSDVNYVVSRMGLWRIDGPLEGIEQIVFLGYIRDPSGWCEKEVDTPCVVCSANELICFYGGRDKYNKWTEGFAFVNLEVLDESN